MNILEALADEKLFAPYLGGDPSTWAHWFSAIRALYGLKLNRADRNTIRQCTGRRALRKLPVGGFSSALFLTGRRSGKSRIAAAIGGFEALFGGHETRLSPGEIGLVAICAPTKLQSTIVLSYLRAVFSAPLLAAEVAQENRDGFTLRNGLHVKILTGDHRSIRGFTLVAAIVDEIAFFGLDEQARVKSDTELIRALKPALATTGGKLVCISSPYAKRGWTHRTFRRHFGNSPGCVLVWNTPSRYMNPTLPAAVVDDAMAEDPAAARSEYLGEFRDDVADFTSREVVEALVIKGRQELMARPNSKIVYTAFYDASGGRGEDAALAIVHTQKDRVILDLLREWRAPHNPYVAIREAVQILREWGIRRVTGDNYAGDFVSRAFQALGAYFQKCEKPKSELYLEFLPIICSRGVELLDVKRLVDQLSNLERRTRSGGKDSVDHPQGGRDDLANAVAGAVVMASKGTIRVGGLGAGGNRAVEFVAALCAG